MRIKLDSLRTRLLLYGATAVLATTALVGYLDFRLVEGQTQAAIQEHMLEQATAVARTVEMLDDPSAVQAYLERLPDAGESHEMAVIDQQGVILASTRPESVGQSIEQYTGQAESGLWQVLAGTRPLAWGRMDHHGQQVLEITLPLYGDSGNPTAITGALHYIEPYHQYQALILRTLLTRGAASLLLIALLIIPLWFYVRRAVLHPVEKIVAADRRVNTEGIQAALIPKAEIPDTELGEVMRSRNEALHRLNEKMQQAEAQAAELKVLERVAATLNRAVELGEPLELSLAAVMELIGSEAGWITLLEESGDMRLAAAHGLPPALEADDRREMRWSGCTCQRKLLAGELTAAINILECERLHRAQGDTRGLRYHATVPIRIRGRVLSNLNLTTPPDRVFTDDELRGLTTVGEQFGVAIERVRLFEAERRRADEMDALRAILADISAELELPKLLQTALERAVTLLDATGGEIGLYNETKAELEIVASHNMGENYTGTRMGLGEGAMGHVAETREPLIIQDYEVWEGRSPQYSQGPWHAVMAAPLTVGRRLIGAIAIVDADPARRFTSSDLRLLNLFAQHAAIAVENAQLFTEIERRAEALASLSEASRVVTASLDVQEVLNSIVALAGQVLNSSYTSLVLVEEDGTFNISAEDYQDIGPIEAQARPAGITRQIITTGEPQIFDEVVDDGTHNPDLIAAGIKSYAGVPLIVGGRSLGVLFVTSIESHAFSDQLSLLTTFVNQAAIAIENARLFEAAQRRAEEAETLREAGAAVVATLQQDEAIERILEQLDRVVPYDSASVQLLRNGYLEIVGGRGWPDPEAVVGLCFPMPGNNPNTVVIQERRPHFLNTAPDTHVLFNVLESHNHVQSWLGVPLIVRDQVIGMLAVNSAQPNYFTPDHARLVAAFADQVAIALENVRLFESEQRQRRLAETLQDVAATLNSTLDLAEILERMLKRLGQVIPFDSCAVMLIEDDHFRVVAGQGFPNPEVIQDLRIPVTANKLFAEIQRTHRPLVLNDAQADPRFAAFGETTYVRGWIGVPLISKDKVIGTMTVDSRTPWAYGEREAEIAFAFAGQAAIAIENARLFKAEQRRREETAALLDIMHVASSSLKLKEVLKHIAQRTAEVCQANRCSIFLLDDTGEYLQPVMSQFADGHADPELWQLFKSTTDRLDATSLFHEAIRERQPTLLNDPARTDLLPRHWTQPFDIQKLLAVPLISHDQAIGLMALDHTDADREFTPDQMDLALTIGGRVAASIDNTRLYAKTQQLAITDSLTGLPNRRKFFEVLEAEIARARRYKTPLALAILDLDNLKHINDTYGHQAGDEALQQVAQTMRQISRETDLAARYGGDEFVLLLPHTSFEGARHLGHRLLKEVCQISLDNGEHLSISVGIAVLAGDGDENDKALLARADQALYQAKQSGRGCVVADDRGINATAPLAKTE